HLPKVEHDIWHGLALEESAFISSSDHLQQDEIDLETLSFQVRIDEERFRSQQIRDSERRVVSLIKRPLVALRYQLQTGEVRRFQMNFHPDSGYDIAVSVFRAIGLPISDMNEPPPGSQGGIKQPSSVLQLNHQPLLPRSQWVDDTQINSDLSQRSNNSYHYESPGLAGRHPFLREPNSEPDKRAVNGSPPHPEL
ncbi:MAG: hypothetical protein Q9224_007769, partial [Gallowayella concinna]